MKQVLLLLFPQAVQYVRARGVPFFFFLWLVHLVTLQGRRRLRVRAQVKSELAVTYSTPHTTMRCQIEGSASFSAVMVGALACRWETWSSFSSTTGRPLVSCLSHHPRLMAPVSVPRFPHTGLADRVG